MTQNNISFTRDNNDDFTITLRKRINEYFRSKNKSKFGNYNILVKSIVMISLYLVPYFFLLSGIFTSGVAVVLLYALMGLGVAGIGLNIMHDANHGVLTKSRKLNSILAFSMDFIGSNGSLWRIQHNVLHHTYTNIHEADEDLNNFPFLLRFSPNQKLRKAHGYQYIYAWFFYAQMTLARILFTDFIKVFEYHKNGHIKTKKEFVKSLVILILFKSFYFTYIFVLPILLLDVSPWAIITGFILMHQVAGFILAVIFQLAHVMPDLNFPVAESDGKVNEKWLIHELKTTCNFGTNSKILTWLVGGLNHQVEHHLFSNICHIHYPAISSIVRDTAVEYGLPYNNKKTFLSAIHAHLKMLKDLGNR